MADAQGARQGQNRRVCPVAGLGEGCAGSKVHASGAAERNNRHEHAAGRGQAPHDAMKAALQEFGYYLHEGRAYFNKFDIFEAALAKGDWAPAIEFKFHVPDLIADCTIEPAPPL